MTAAKQKPKLLSEKQILRASKANYMNADQLGFFRQRLIDLHDTVCTRIEDARNQMVNPMGFSDPSDRATGGRAIKNSTSYRGT